MLLGAPAQAQVADVLDSIQNRAEEIHYTFQDELLKSTRSETQDLSDLAPLMAFLMVINIFSILYRSGPDKLLVEMSKMAVWSFIALCIMGGSFYKSTGIANMFSINTTVCGKEFVSAGGSSLDRDVLNYFKYAADELACGLFKEDVNRKYNQAITDMFTVTGMALSFPEQCLQLIKDRDASSGDQSVLNCVRNHKKVEAEKSVAEVCTGSGWFPVSCYLGKIVDMFTFSTKFWTSIIIVILQAFVQIIQFLILFSVMIGIAGSLLFLKLISPFLVMDSVRGRVLSACKVPLAVSLYGFTHKLLMYFLAGLMDSITNASLVAYAKFGVAAEVDGIMYVYLLITFACISMLVMQIVAIMKVPSMAKMLVDLSLEQLVNVGGQMLEAAFGMAKSVGLTAATAGAAVATGGAALAAGAKGALSGGAGALGRFGDTQRTGGQNNSSPMVNAGTGRTRYPTGQGFQYSSSSIGSGSRMMPSDTSSGDKKESALQGSTTTQKSDSGIPVKKENKQNNAPAEDTAKPTSEPKPTKPNGGSDDGGGDGIKNKNNSSVSLPVAKDAKDAGVEKVNNETVSSEMNATTSSDNSTESSAGVVANSRSRKGSSKKAVKGEELIKAQTFAEHEALSEQRNKKDSDKISKKKQVEDKLYGAFGSAKGRKELAKAVLSGTGSFIGSVMQSAMKGPGSELDVTGSITKGLAPVKNSFEESGKRYAEFREGVEGEERTRSQNVESGLESINTTESFRNSVLTTDEYTDLMNNLDGISAGVTDEETRQATLRKIEAGIKAPTPEMDEQLLKKHNEALEANAEYMSEKNQISDNSTKFVEGIQYFASKEELTNREVAALNKLLKSPINQEALEVYTQHKERLEILMRSQLLKQANVKVKK